VTFSVVDITYTLRRYCFKCSDAASAGLKLKSHVVCVQQTVPDVQVRCRCNPLPLAFICSPVVCCQIDSWDALTRDIPPAITVFFQGPKHLLQNAHAVPALNTLLATRVPQLISLLNVLAECSPEHARTQTVAALQRPTAEQELQVCTCKLVVSHKG
jgi:hypothetical protein